MFFAYLIDKNKSMECTHCSRLCKNHNSLRNHERLCKHNPERQIIKSNLIRYNEVRKELGVRGINQHTKAKQEGRETSVSKETRQKISKARKGRRYTEEERRRRSEIMQRVVREKPESYSASNVNGRVKKVLYGEVWLDSQWECEFAKWCDNNHIAWERCNTSFEYDWNGKRLYYPDFYLKDLGYYVEVKGYQRERDLAKWRSVPNLFIIKSKEIEKIRKGEFMLGGIAPPTQQAHSIAGSSPAGPTL